MKDYGEKLGFIAHFFHINDPRQLNTWKVKEIVSWYGRGVSLYNKMNAAPEKEED